MKSKIKFNGIIIGVAILTFAVCMILNGLGILPGTAYLIAMSVVFATITVRAAISLQFTVTFFGLGHLAHLFRGYLQIPDSFAPWMLILACVLVGVGLDIIFKNLKKKIKHDNEGVYIDVEVNDDKQSTSGGAGTTTSNQSTFRIENGFSTQTHYVRTDRFVDGHIENGFGTVTVYFDEVTMEGSHSNLHLENGFGTMNIYLPSSWSLDLHQANGMGNIQVNGTPSIEAGAPVVHVHAENGFGKILLNFN